MDKQKIARLKYLDELAERGFISADEDRERTLLRSQLQEIAMQENRTQQAVDGGQGPSQVSSGRRLTFREAMSRAAKQINLSGFYQQGKDGWIPGPDYQLANTLCMVMAEVYMAADRHVLYVCGMPMEAEQAREVYRELTFWHIECVIRKIRQSQGKNIVKFQRPYLRTMLYNVVFEYEAQTQAGMNALDWV